MTYILNNTLVKGVFILVQILPSILSANFANLAQDCKRVITPDNNFLHFDVMDGVFVPNISFGLPVLSDLKKALPETWFDVHLMIIEPQNYIERFVKAGADAVTFHLEADSPVDETIKLIKQNGSKAGLSLRPSTPIEAIFPYLQALDLVLIMSVEPGFGGQSFMPESVERIEAVKKEAERQNTSIEILVDGGINAQTAEPCKRAGATGLVAGSAVFGHAEPKQMIYDLAK